MKSCINNSCLFYFSLFCRSFPRALSLSLVFIAKMWQYKYIHISLQELILIMAGSENKMKWKSLPPVFFRPSFAPCLRLFFFLLVSLLTINKMQKRERERKYIRLLMICINMILKFEIFFWLIALFFFVRLQPILLFSLPFFLSLFLSFSFFSLSLFVLAFCVYLCLIKVVFIISLISLK